MTQATIILNFGTHTNRIVRSVRIVRSGTLSDGTPIIEGVVRLNNGNLQQCFSLGTNGIFRTYPMW